MAVVVDGTKNIVRSGASSIGVGGRGTGTTWAVICWMRSPDNVAGSDFAQLYAETDAATDAYLNCQMNKAGRLRFFYRPGGFGQPTASIDITGPYDDNVWYWTAFICLGDASYRALVGSTDPDAAPAVGTSTTSITNSVTRDELKVGSGGNNLPTGGAVAHLMGFQTSLTDDECKAVAFNMGKIAVEPHYHWELDGLDELTTAHDLTSNAFDGTYTNSPTAAPDHPPVIPAWWGLGKLGARGLLDQNVAASLSPADLTVTAPSITPLVGASIAMTPINLAVTAVPITPRTNVAVNLSTADATVAAIPLTPAADTPRSGGGAGVVGTASGVVQTFRRRFRPDERRLKLPPLVDTPLEPHEFVAPPRGRIDISDEVGEAGAIVAPPRVKLPAIEEMADLPLDSNKGTTYYSKTDQAIDLIPRAILRAMDGDRRLLEAIDNELTANHHLSDNRSRL